MSAPGWIALLTRPGAIWLLRLLVLLLAVPGVFLVARFAVALADALEEGRQPARWSSLLAGVAFLGAASIVAALELTAAILRRTRPRS